MSAHYIGELIESVPESVRVKMEMDQAVSQTRMLGSLLGESQEIIHILFRRSEMIYWHGKSVKSNLTHFEIAQEEGWGEKHAMLQNLCLRVNDFLEENPGIAEEVIITKDSIRATLKKQEVQRCLMK